MFCSLCCMFFLLLLLLLFLEVFFFFFISFHSKATTFRQQESWNKVRENLSKHSTLIKNDYLKIWRDGCIHNHTIRSLYSQQKWNTVKSSNFHTLSKGCSVMVAITDNKLKKMYQITENSVSFRIIVWNISKYKSLSYTDRLTHTLLWCSGSCLLRRSLVTWHVDLSQGVKVSCFYGSCWPKCNRHNVDTF